MIERIQEKEESIHQIIIFSPIIASELFEVKGVLASLPEDNQHTYRTHCSLD
jgi:hypothetical protein